ncbi:MAG TPA: hypothetical protein VFE13_01990 [Caulobacteraceae bacterium]|nr:hypothetical protein [Caulobacteraceae bacterium]
MSRAGAATAALLTLVPGGLAALGAPAFAGAGVTAVAMAPGPAKPAESGARDSAATVGPLAIGATVVDRNGVPIGRVTRMATDKHGRQMAEVRQNEDLYSVPLTAIHAEAGRAVSDMTADDLKAAGAAH